MPIKYMRLDLNFLLPDSRSRTQVVLSVMTNSAQGTGGGGDGAHEFSARLACQPSWWQISQELWILNFCISLVVQDYNFSAFKKHKEVPELSDAEWKWHLAFLTDVTELLNNFNMQLQGKGKLICDMQSHVKAFEVKLSLFIKQVEEENFCHLPPTQNLLAEKLLIAFPNKTCMDSLEKLQKEFQFRFKELHLHEQDIQLFHYPFSIDIENVDTIYQIELAELQNCDSLKDAFKSSSLHNFYASLPSETYPHVRNQALKMATIFGSTYVCEQTFSRMKHLKSPTRSRLTDAHLHHLLQLAMANMESDIDHFISQKQAHSSH
ncbi:EPM2A-interacting protein 1-like isoform 1-T4 [Sarcophilus harrisii]